MIGLVIFAVNKSWIHSPTFFYQTLIFLFFSTVVIFAYLYKVSKPEFFVQLYLMTMAVKLMAYGVYAYFVITTDPSGAAVNVAFFLLSYFFFTATEIAFLYRKIAAKSQS